MRVQLLLLLFFSSVNAFNPRITTHVSHTRSISTTTHQLRRVINFSPLQSTPNAINGDISSDKAIPYLAPSFFNTPAFRYVGEFLKTT